MPSRLTATLLTAAGLAAALAGAAPARAACTAGVVPFGGASARVFCGPAKATLRVGGRTLRFSGGSCETTPRYVAVDIGTVVLGQTSKRKPDYFGLDVGAFPGGGTKPAARDGSYTGGVIAAVSGGKAYSVRGDTATIALAGNRRHGTFAATLLFGGGPVSGTFSCG